MESNSSSVTLEGDGHLHNDRQSLQLAGVVRRHGVIETEYTETLTMRLGFL